MSNKAPKNLDSKAVHTAWVEANRNTRAAARKLGVDPATVRRHVDAIEGERTAQKTKDQEIAGLRATVKDLQDRVLTDERVKREILQIAEAPAKAPNWTEMAPRKVTDLTGVPTLFASDWHWGEVVRPAEIGGVNEYNLKVAHRRAQNLLEVSTKLLTQHLSSARYPGICLLLGGDMMSGDIHEELSETNELPAIPALLDLLGVLKTTISGLQEAFGNVFVVGVTGNHGRTTKKPRAKRRNHSNFDWLLYQLLMRDFAGNKRVSFQVPEGPDAYYRLYGHRYLLTHGDQFRGGDGMIGMLGPTTRGNLKKRSRQQQIQQPYDTLLMGHFHQLVMLDSMIINGSLKGYDEYAAAGNFQFESPRQALWITHPEHGITFSMPVYVDRGTKPVVHEWASVHAA